MGIVGSGDFYVVENNTQHLDAALNCRFFVSEHQVHWTAFEYPTLIVSCGIPIAPVNHV